MKSSASIAPPVPFMDDRGGHTKFKARFRCRRPEASGEIVVIQRGEGGCSFLVGWRKDRRHKKSITPLVRYDSRQDAIEGAISLSNEYLPEKTCEETRFRDSFRARLYRWENGLPGNRVLCGPEEAKSVVRNVCDMIGVPAPEITIGGSRLKSHSYFKPSRGIHLSRQMCDTHTVLHELAHYLTWRMNIAEASHGKVFTANLAFAHILHSQFSLEAHVIEGLIEAKIPFNHHLLQRLIQKFVAL